MSRLKLLFLLATLIHTKEEEYPGIYFENICLEVPSFVPAVLFPCGGISVYRSREVPLGRNVLWTGMFYSYPEHCGTFLVVFSTVCSSAGCPQKSGK